MGRWNLFDFWEIRAVRWGHCAGIIRSSTSYYPRVLRIIPTVSADQGDKAGPRKHIYSWTLGNKFVQSDGRIDPNPWDGLCGVDPKSKKLTWWGFFADGTAGPIYLIESTDKVLVLVLEKIAMKPPTFDHERLDVYRLSILKRIVSILTRLIPRKPPVAADTIEYEYRDADYEYDETRFTKV